MSSLIIEMISTSIAQTNHQNNDSLKTPTMAFQKCRNSNYQCWNRATIHRSELPLHSRLQTTD